MPSLLKKKKKWRHIWIALFLLLSWNCRLLYTQNNKWIVVKYNNNILFGPKVLFQPRFLDKVQISWWNIFLSRGLWTDIYSLLRNSNWDLCISITHTYYYSMGILFFGNFFQRSCWLLITARLALVAVWLWWRLCHIS